jgi:large subunit ribosomal protein LP1
MSINEQACAYAALILQDEQIEITADKLTTLIGAAGLEVESIWPTIFAKALQGKDLSSLLFSAGSGAAPVAGGAAAPAAAAAGGASAAPVAEEKAEEKEESDDDMGFGLFD